MLKERKVLGKVTINHQTGCHCEVQLIKEIYDDETGEVKASEFERFVVEPGDHEKAKDCGVDHITSGAWADGKLSQYKAK